MRSKFKMSCTSSDDSDLELMKQIIDWDSEEEKGNELARFSKGRVNYLQEYEDHQFTYMFRLSKTVVEDLLGEIFPYLRVTSKRNHGTSPLHQLLLTLRYYALGTMLKSVAEFIGVSKSSAGRIVKDVSLALSKLSPKYLYFHSRTDKDFETIAGFPHVLGVIGGTQILMHSPDSNFAHKCQNQVTVTSMHVQAVCDADLKFMNVIAVGSHSAHDATIFNQSELRTNCENSVYGDRWLLGDNSYPCKPYLLTPIVNPQTIAEQRYNEAHIQTRNKIERCFKAWKCRFPILFTKMRLSIENTQNLIIATAMLHNLSRDHGIEDMDPEIEIPNYNIQFQTQTVPECSPMNDFCVRQSLIDSHFACN